MDFWNSKRQDIVVRVLYQNSAENDKVLPASKGKFQGPIPENKSSGSAASVHVRLPLYPISQERTHLTY